MAIDINRPKGYRRAWRGGVNLMRTVTVCDACRCASCWHGKFFCERAKMAGTVDLPLATLMQEQRFLCENEEYWFTDPANGMIDHAALEAYRHNYPESCSPLRPCNECGGAGLTMQPGMPDGEPEGLPCPKCSHANQGPNDAT